MVRQKEASAVVEAMTVIAAGVVAVTSDPDIGIGDEAIERDALERALEDILHDKYRLFASRPCGGNSPEFLRVNASK